MFLEYVINVQSLFILSFLLCVGLLYFKNKIYFFCGVGLIIFLWIPYIFDQLFVGRIVTNIDDSKEWFSFLSGYLGSGFGAVATLSGIFYQLNYTRKIEEKNRLQGLILYLKYSLENINESNIHIYQIENNSFYDEERKGIFQISEEFLSDNIKLLFSLGEDKAKEILDFFLKVFYFNKMCLRLSEIKKSSDVLSEIKKILINEEQIEIVEEIKEANLKILEIFKILDTILTYKSMYSGLKDHIEIQKKIKLKFTSLIACLNAEKIIIKNIKYIKRRKDYKINFDDDIEKIKKEIFNDEVKEEEIFYYINKVKIELISNLITSEEEENIKYELFLALNKELRILKMRFFSENKIIEEKKKIKQESIKLISMLNNYNKRKKYND